MKHANKTSKSLCERAVVWRRTGYVFGQERKGKGVGEHALFRLSLDASLVFFLFFFHHTLTHQAAVTTYHSPGDRKNMS